MPPESHIAFFDADAIVVGKKFQDSVVGYLNPGLLDQIEGLFMQ
jgi:hypothetical protein